jgi:hypothetical protein
MTWQPIKTAPKDGTRILAVKVPFLVTIAWWFPDYQKWMTTDAEDYPDNASWDTVVADMEYFPDYWMPLPKAPNLGELHE